MAIWTKHECADKKSARIVVLDSGLSSKHDWGTSIGDGLTFRCGAEGSIERVFHEYEDDVGHGTAVSHAILKECPGATIIPVKIFDSNMETSFEMLLAALEYVCENIICDLVHISAGVTHIEGYKILTTILDRLLLKNILVVSAFDNEGCVSYPAACPQVIGVDTAKMDKQDEGFTW